MDIYTTARADTLLSSNYTNNIIEKIGFEKTYETIQTHLSMPQFKLLASKSLLHHPATKEEYNDLANQLHDKINAQSSEFTNNSSIGNEPIELSIFLEDFGRELSITPITQIDILSRFDPLHAIKFYRDTLHQSIIRGYDRLEEKSVITEGLRDFLVFDNYLSPLTAHPASNVTRILFSKPFERIYEDAYLMGEQDFSLLSYRACAIYTHFSDFLFEYFKYDPLGQKDIEILIKEMIYSWNVASTRFDLACNCLTRLYNKKTGSGNYHLKSDGINFNVIDLVDNRQLLPSGISSSLLVLGSTPLVFAELKFESERLYPEIMKDPFSSLRPCLSFKDIRCGYEFIPIEYILSQLKSKMKANA